MKDSCLSTTDRRKVWTSLMEYPPPGPTKIIIIIIHRKGQLEVVTYSERSCRHFLGHKKSDSITPKSQFESGQNTLIAKGVVPPLQ
jgi:hypothetical protein